MNIIIREKCFLGGSSEVFYSFWENPRQPYAEEAAQKNYEKIHTWIASGKDIDEIVEDGQTQLARAASLGYIKTVEFLIEKGANLNKANIEESGWTPLMCAAYHIHQEVIELLLKSGADAKVKNKEGLLASDIVRAETYHNKNTEKKEPIIELLVKAESL